MADLDAELEKRSMDSRRSSQRIGDAHLADQLANFPTVQSVGRYGSGITSTDTI